MSSETMKTWSYSRWKTYAQCPYKAGQQYVHGVREPSNAAMDRGSANHDMAQKYVEGTISIIPYELAKFEVQFQTVAKRDDVYCELEWGFASNWEPCDYADGWLRMRLDTFYFKSPDALHVTDYKTGRVYDENEKQLSLYALGCFIKFPSIQKIDADLWYLDHGITRASEFTRDDVPDLLDVWNARVAPMLIDTEFVPCPNQYCRNCYHSHTKHGTCIF